MRTFSAVLLTLVTTALLSACKQNYIALVDTNAKGEVPQLGNLHFKFNKVLHPDSLLNTWDSTDYLAFEPSIPGRFRWEGPEELVFSPLQPLAPATTYKVRFKNELFRYSEYDKVEGEAPTFFTAPLQMGDAQLTWLEAAGTGVASPQITLRFNYPVKAEALNEKLTIEVDGESAPFALQTTGVSSVIGVKLNGLKAEDKNHQATINLAPGLKPDKGSNSSKEALVQSLVVPSPYVLTVNNVEAEHTGTEGLVRLYTSQLLTGNDIRQAVAFEPAVPFTVEPTEFGAILRSSGFDVEKSYALNIEKGLRGRLGGVLKEAYNGAVGFGKLESNIRFTNSKAVYLSKRGAGNIEVQVTNTPRIKLIVSKIYENNLLQAAANGYEPRDDSEPQYASSQEEGEYGNTGFVDAMAGDVIYTKEIDTRSLPKSGSGRLLSLSQLEDRLPEAKGIYHVLIRSAEDWWVRDSRFISFSDISLIARQGTENMVVFASSIKTARALDGVTVNVYGKNNQLLGTGATDKEGVAQIRVAQKSFAGYAPAMVIAKTADDFTYLPFNNTRVNTSRFDVGGREKNPSGLDAFVYAERDIYRPGEQLNYAVVVRDRAWKPAADLPVKIKFLLPNGKELKTFRKGLNEQGATEGNLALSTAAITGSYTLEVYSSNEVLLATKSFNIEEFVPDRIRVTAKLTQAVLRPSETTTLNINAVNFFGPPAANRKLETEIQIRQKAFTSKRYHDYDFTLANQQSFTDKQVQEGTTDAEGNAAVLFDVPSMYQNVGLLQALFYTTVFDETGRPVSRQTTADIYTQDVFYGIKNDNSYYYPLNSPVKFDLVSLNKDGNPSSALATVQVIKHEYRTVLTKNGEFFRYESQKEDKILAEKQQTIGDQTAYHFIPRSPGDYEIRVFRPGASTYVKKSFYSYGGWGNTASSFDVNTEGHVDIETDKEKYLSGETAKLLFKAPFNGKLLVTVEREGVLSHHYLAVEKRTASMELKLLGEHVPNVYVTATVFRPHEMSDMPLTVAHGFQNLTVEEKDRRIPVQISAQKNARSKTRQRVTVKAVPGSYVSLAAVDNGVLQVSDFKTPDPYGFYYQKTALGVVAYDMYPLLFPELRGRFSSTGGDGTSLEKRVNPMPAKRFKILSFWSGLKKADGSGNVVFDYDVPQFSGEVRLMAVAFKDDKFGSAESTTTIADPVVLSSSLPRFISPGDTVLVPVTISNTTNRTATGKATITANGPVRVVGNASQTVAIQRNSEGRAAFQLVANTSINVSKIVVSVNALGETFSEETDISVRPPSTLQKRSGSGAIAGGQQQAIDLSPGDFLPGSFRSDLVVSRSPVTQVVEHLQYLLTYPYGCTEQTVSAAFPQLYYGDMADALQLNPAGKQSAAANVMEAIRKIKMRQLYNGAVTLWDGEGREDWWATVYAAHFLLEARKAGYDVDNSLLETMLTYLDNRLRTKTTVVYYYNRDQQRKIAPKEVAYSLYVLALASRPQVSTMNYYKAAGPLLALDSKYLLSAAYAISGDRRSFHALLPSAFSGEESVQQTGGSYYSALRDEAIALNALLEVDPGNAQVPQMAQHVGQRLRSDRWVNTQERAFSFLALGKLARTAARSTATASIRVNGKTIATVSEKEWKGNSTQLKGTTVDVVTSGTGKMYYSWVAEGISSSGAFRQEDNYLKVRRQFYDRNGNVITGKTFRQNDLVIVGISLEKAYNNAIENVVITDLLPAGFEIENPRTKEIPGMDWIKDAAEPQVLDVRDDRIHFFVNAIAPKQTYYYAVRAVSLGSFQQGPVSADAMYNGEMHSYHGAQRIRVVP